MGRGARGGFMRGRAYADHVGLARQMRQQPGTWVEVGLYNSRQSALAIVNHMHSAQNLAYVPAGAFRGQVRMVDEGYMVDGTYVGEQPGGGK